MNTLAEITSKNDASLGVLILFPPAVQEKSQVGKIVPLKSGKPSRGAVLSYPPWDTVVHQSVSQSANPPVHVGMRTHAAVGVATFLFF